MPRGNPYGYPPSETITSRVLRGTREAVQAIADERNMRVSQFVKELIEKAIAEAHAKAA